MDETFLLSDKNMARISISIGLTSLECKSFKRLMFVFDFKFLNVTFWSKSTTVKGVKENITCF